MSGGWQDLVQTVGRKRSKTKFWPPLWSLQKFVASMSQGFSFYRVADFTETPVCHLVAQWSQEHAMKSDNEDVIIKKDHGNGEA